MQYFAIALAVGSLVPTALTQPHGHGHYKHHHKSGYGTGALSASPTYGAPYTLSNGTVGASPATGTAHYETLTLKSTLYQTEAASSSQAPSESAVESGASNAGTCGSTSTVIFKPTTTVFITAGAAPAESGAASSAPVESAPVESAPVAPVKSSVEAPAPVKSSKPAPVAPVSTAPASASPIKLSPEPETSAKVQSQAASSAPVVSSAAPVASASSAPANPATSATPATPPEGGSPVSTGDYCSNTRDASGNVIPYTGANYTGGEPGKKRGIVYVDGTDAWKNGLLTYANANDQILWLGNYYSVAPDDFMKANKTEFVPQMYGRASTGDWNRNADSNIKKWDSKHFLSFGEPGTPNPTNYDNPTDGATLYKNYMQPYAEKGISVGAPGSLQNKQDWTWDQDFLCNAQKLNLKVDFIAAHWFDAAAPLAQQVSRAKGTIETYINVAKGKPLWMDNIWAKGTPAEQKAFMDELVPWLEQNPAVQRYGWTPQDSDNSGTGFTNLDGSVTDVGSHFAGLGTS